MSKVIRENASYLRLFHEQNLTLKQKKALLKSITPGQLKAIVTVVYNLLYSDNIKIPSKLFIQLGRYKKTLRLLVDKSTPLRDKKRILGVQIVILILTIVSPLLKSL
jgi:hypothetical protein